MVIINSVSFYIFDIYKRNNDNLKNCGIVEWRISIYSFTHWK